MCDHTPPYTTHDINEAKKNSVPTEYEVELAVNKTSQTNKIEFTGWSMH